MPSIKAIEVRLDVANVARSVWMEDLLCDMPGSRDIVCHDPPQSRQSDWCCKRCRRQQGRPHASGPLLNLPALCGHDVAGLGELQRQGKRASLGGPRRAGGQRVFSSADGERLREGGTDTVSCAKVLTPHRLGKPALRIHEPNNALQATATSVRSRSRFQPRLSA